MGDWVDQRVKVECGQVRVLCLDVDDVGRVIPGEMNMFGHVVVKVGEGDPVLGTDGLTNDDLKSRAEKLS